MPKDYDYNFDVMTSTLRTVLNQHGIGNAEDICKDYERQVTQNWRNQGVPPEQFNELFQQGQARGVSQRQ